MFRKNKKSVENNGDEPSFVSRRTPQAMSPPRRREALKNTASSWRPNASINNIEQEKKKEVDREIKEKNRQRRKRLRARLTLKISLILLSLAGFFMLAGLLSKRLHFEIDNGGNTAFSESLSGEVNSSLNGGVFGYFIPGFMRYDGLEKKFSEKDEIQKIDLSFNFWKMRTEAKVKTSVALVKWLGPEGQISYVNQDGEVFEPSVEFLKLFNPIEISGSGVGVRPGSKQLARSDKLAWVVKVIPILRREGIELKGVNIDGQSFKNVEVLLNGVETRLIFSIAEDYEQSGVAASKVIKFLSGTSGVGALAPYGYIDVRTPERVVYK